MTKPNRNLYSLLFLGSIFLAGCQAQDNFCKDPARNKNCKKGKITTKEEYYGADFLQSIERLGGNENAIRGRINRVIKKDHVKLDLNPCTWVALQDIDENRKKKDEIVPFYSRKNRSIKKNDCQSDRDEPIKDLWNREHIYPVGRFNRDKKVPAYTDLHHLVATDYSVNSGEQGRKSLDFGTVAQKEDLGADQCTECKRSSNYWEPGKDQKGQVARILFYMDLRYEPGSELDLSLVTGKTPESGSFRLGDKTALLEWHCTNKVRNDEKCRNKKVQDWQGNRNPFIDFPALVEMIYGDCPNGSVHSITGEDGDESDVCDKPDEHNEGTSDEVGDDNTNGVEPVEPVEPDDKDCKGFEESDGTKPKVRIISALVNPEATDAENETVTIKNCGNVPIDLTGWTIAGKNGNTSELKEKELLAGEKYTIEGLGRAGSAQLTNKVDSAITLYDEDKTEIDQVTYDRTTSGEEIGMDNFSRRTKTSGEEIGMDNSSREL